MKMKQSPDLLLLLTVTLVTGVAVTGLIQSI